MPCYHPLIGYKAKDLNPSGKRSIVFNAKEGLKDQASLTIPCGKCIGCRIERSREWALRCVNEAQMHDHNCFITLTYRDEDLPQDGSVNKKHFQDFIKRLRARDKKILYFHCGEYGEKYGRPHYHACIFGYAFKDKIAVGMENENLVYESPELHDLWPHGNHRIGKLTFESAAYVARYIMKKLTGPEMDIYYQEIDIETGEILKEKEREYVTMSRRPAIGKSWYEKYKRDIFPSDFIIHEGKRFQVPKYYMYLLGKEDEEFHDYIKEQRKVKARVFAKDNTRERLLVKEDIQYLKMDKLPRRLENDL